jgi:acyl dehydratase
VESEKLSGQLKHEGKREAIMEEIRFNDVERLKTKISDVFGNWSEPVEISQEMINQFADVTGDHQWIHIDVERSKRESPFKSPVAHGFLTLSLIPRLSMPIGVQIVGANATVNYGANKLRFVSPVPAGAKIHGRARLCGVEATKAGTLVTREIHLHLVGNEKPALIYEALTLYVG